MNDLYPDFRIFKRRCHSNQLSFSAILFLCCNSKTTRDRHVVPRKENIENSVFCRMAPSVMTSGDHECQNCFRFVLFLRVVFAQKVHDRSSPFFPPASIYDCCEIGLRSTVGRCHWNTFLSFSDIFRKIEFYFCYALTPFELLYSCCCGLSNCCRFVRDWLYSLSWSCCRHSICCGYVVGLLTNLLWTLRFHKLN